MLQTSGEKMSKSLGNFMLLHDLLKNYEANLIRLLMLQTHYRSPLDFSEERLEEAKISLQRIQSLIDRAAFSLEKATELKKKRQLARQMFPSAAATKLQSAYREAQGAFQAEMDDDFNTAGAVGHLFDLVRDVNSFLDSITAASEGEDSALDEDELFALQAAFDTLLELFSVLGISLEPSAQTEINPEAEALLEERSVARANKDWARADEIRDELDVLGFEVKDTAAGPQLVRK